jgi:hypothetical protein
MRYRLTEKGAQRRGERERTAGLEPEDEAARWLEEHDSTPQPEPSKSLFKSKELHRWRKARGRPD